MKQAQYPWRSKYGASHRMYFDTPPLKGLRLEPFRLHLGSFRNQSVCTYRAIFAVPSGTAVADANGGRKK
jgi:hypothetical protein